MFYKLAEYYDKSCLHYIFYNTFFSVKTDDLINVNLILIRFCNFDCEVPYYDSNLKVNILVIIYTINNFQYCFVYPFYVIIQLRKDILFK